MGQQRKHFLSKILKQIFMGTACTKQPKEYFKYGSYENIVLKARDGINIGAALFKPEEVNKDTKFVIFLHGSGTNRDDISTAGQIKYFVSDNYVLLIPDYRDFGDSEGEFTRETVNLDVLASFDFLINNYEAKSISVIAFSFGTTISAEYIKFIHESKNLKISNHPVKNNLIFCNHPVKNNSIFCNHPVKNNLIFCNHPVKNNLIFCNHPVKNNSIFCNHPVKNNLIFCNHPVKNNSIFCNHPVKNNSIFCNNRYHITDFTEAYIPDKLILLAPFSSFPKLMSEFKLVRFLKYFVPKIWNVITDDFMYDTINNLEFYDPSKLYLLHGTHDRLIKISHSIDIKNKFQCCLKEIETDHDRILVNHEVWKVIKDMLKGEI
ncbi:hypothetical protein P3W45_001501 [Vairimorpha bombi]|jgi:hypothetical protein